jgi:hypothetical protein
MSASTRLVHLLELADKGPALRAALAEEVAEMLTAWPADCPLEMRAPCEKLLAQAGREVDRDARARLRVRLFADPALAARLLPRDLPERALVEAARHGDVVAPLARALGLPPETAQHILEDGWALAIAAKAVGLSRAAYSALALLAHPPKNGATLALDAFEQVGAAEAARQLRDWRNKAAASAAA